MFRRKSEEELWKLQQELLAVEAEEEEPEYGPEDETEDSEELMEQVDNLIIEDILEEVQDLDDPEEEEDPPKEAAVHAPAHRYGKGSPKRFEEDDFFDDEDLEDGDFLYKKDYKKAKRKKNRKKFGLFLLMVLEILGLGAIFFLWAKWLR